MQYVYSAWAPQFAERLKLSSTESNLVGLSGNLGMYSMGVPVGMFVDYRGPRPAVIAGSILLGLGYFPLHQAYDAAAGSVPLLCFFSYLTGLGGCMAFAAAVKTSALNWPHHRGTATAFPLAAFGLSAFFFSVFGSLFFPGGPSTFLMILACGTFGLTFVGFFFMRVLPHPAYHALPSTDVPRNLSESQQLRRTSSEEAKRLGQRPVVEPGTSPTTATLLAEQEAAMTPDLVPTAPASAEVDTPPVVVIDEPEVDETSSLVSNSSSLPGDVLVQSSVDMDRSHRIDIRGVQLLRKVEFWELFSIMGILTGIGLMTIKYVTLPLISSMTKRNLSQQHWQRRHGSMEAL
jgi:Major Facilitator Superfamily